MCSLNCVGPFVNPARMHEQTSIQRENNYTYIIKRGRGRNKCEFCKGDSSTNPPNRHKVTTLKSDVRMVIEASRRHVPRSRTLRSYFRCLQQSPSTKCADLSEALFDNIQCNRVTICSYH